MWLLHARRPYHEASRIVQSRAPELHDKTASCKTSRTVSKFGRSNDSDFQVRSQERFSLMNFRVNRSALQSWLLF